MPKIYLFQIISNHFFESTYRNFSWLKVNPVLLSRNLLIRQSIKFNIKYNNINLMNRYKILKIYQNHDMTIGLGSYGQVKLAKDLKTGDIVAIKIINKIAKSEASLHSTLSHPKIVQLIDIHINFTKQISYIVLQYVKGGTLLDKIKQKKLTKVQIKHYFRDVCEGVDYLHSKNIIHRDVKPENILISEKNEGKLCDFGAAALNFDRVTVCGTYQYMAPQMIQNRPYNQKIDIWALGILLFQLIAGFAPFQGIHSQEVLEQMKTKIYFGQSFDSNDVQIIKLILRVNPTKRPSAKELLKHQYLKFQEKIKSIASTNDEKSYDFSQVSRDPQQNANQIQGRSLHAKSYFYDKKTTFPPFLNPKSKELNSNFNINLCRVQKTVSSSIFNSSTSFFGMNNKPNMSSLMLKSYKRQKQRNI